MSAFEAIKEFENSFDKLKSEASRVKRKINLLTLKIGADLEGVNMSISEIYGTQIKASADNVAFLIEASNRATQAAREAQKSHEELIQRLKKDSESLDGVKAIRALEKELAQLTKSKEVIEHVISNSANMVGYLKKSDLMESGT
jgi:hypothetical protein